MQFLILAYDATDSGAPDRRMAAREAHLATIQSYKDKGNMHIGAAILDDAGKMIGSVIVCDFETREKMEVWLNNDPYVTNKVWGDIKVQPCRVAPPYMKK